MNRKWTAILAIVALLAGTSTVLAQGRNVTIKGSDTMVILGQRWAEVFMQKNPGVTVQVTGGGSGTGIAALLNGTTNIAESSRAMKDKEKNDLQTRTGKTAIELPVAVDGLAVYLNEKNPLNELSIPQIKGIYTGAIRNWKEVGGRDERIILYSRENNSGTYVYFKEEVLGNADYFPTAQTLPGTAAVINAVSKDPRGIGYGGIAYGAGVKHIRVKKDDNSPAVEPTMENVLAAKYPISRYLYFYFAGQPSGDVLKLAQWIMSEDGQAVVEKVGYYPLSPTDRAKFARIVGGGSGTPAGSKAAKGGAK